MLITRFDHRRSARAFALQPKVLMLDATRLARAPVYYDLRAALFTALTAETAQTFEEDSDNDRPR